MKKYFLLGSLVLGLGLYVGCGDGSITTEDSATPEQEAEWEAEMDESVSKAMNEGGGSDYPAGDTGADDGSGADDK